VQDNSVLKMLENSLSDGVLYRFRDPDTGSGDVESMLGVLKAYWGATADTFRDAWNLPPARSRLVHGAGIVSMGFITVLFQRNEQKEVSTHVSGMDGSGSHLTFSAEAQERIGTDLLGHVVDNLDL
jgi:hypothetical protein